MPRQSEGYTCFRVLGVLEQFGETERDIAKCLFKSNFEKSEIRDFVTTFWNLVKGRSSKKNHLFLEL